MPAITVRELNKAITSGNFDPVYLFHGEEGYLVDTNVRRVIDGALAPSERDFNLEFRHADDLTAETLDSLLNTPPIFAARRAVVLREVTSLKKGARAVLDRYLASPSPDLLLILTENEVLAKTEKTLPAKSSVIEFDRLRDKDLTTWVERWVQGIPGASIEPSAVQLLISVVGNKLGELAAELDKLVSYSDGRVIDVAAIEDLVGVRHGETFADLLNAIADRDAPRALELVPHIMAQPKATAVYLIILLTTQMMAIAYARALLDEGGSAAGLERELFSFLSAGKGATAAPWGESVKVFARAAKKWNAAELDAAMEALLQADMRAKNSRRSSDEELVTSLVLQLCVRE
jgi:DNA polymerase-3 subunit delta